MAAQDNGNWFKLYRGILDNTAWAQGSNIQRVLMITLLAKAWWKPGKYIWAGRVVHMQPGQLITTLGELAEACNASIKEIRTALEHLQNLEFVACKSTNKGRLISLVNWEKYQLDGVSEGKQTGKQGAGSGQVVDKQEAGSGQVVDRPTSSHNMYKNIKQGKEGKEYKEGKEGKKGLPLPFPLLKILKTFESDHQSQDLTAALISWATMRLSRGHLSEKDLHGQLSNLMDISRGDISMAIKIVEQSINRQWSQFWPLKEAPQMVRYPKVEKRELKGPPPPKPEDFPGDPERFQQAMNAWTARQGEDNQRVIHRLGPEPTEEEREKILKAMGHIESP